MKMKPVAQGPVAALLLFAGCFAQYQVYEESYIPPFDISHIHKVAVLKFTNRTEREGTGGEVSDRVEALLVTESPYTVVSRIDLDKVAEDNGLTLGGELDRDALKRLGEAASADLLVLGTVEDCDVRTTDYASDEIVRTASLSMRLKAGNTKTGQVIWSAFASGSHSWSGWRYDFNALSAQRCLHRAITQAAAEIRGLYPHIRIVRKQVL